VVPEGAGNGVDATALGQRPLGPAEAAMYFELVPQFVPGRGRGRNDEALDAPPELDTLTAVEEGTPFPRLRIAMMLRPGETIVVMLEHRSAGSVEDVGASDEPGLNQEPLGPALAREPTIGEVIFSDALVLPARGIRTALIVTARGPREFRLNARQP